MHEEHSREQYFFDESTLDALTSFVTRRAAPVLVCCPMLGRRLHAAGREVATLDVDERFAALPSFVRFDLYRPDPAVVQALPVPDLVLVDPPFFNVSLAQLFKALRLVCRFDLATPVMLSYLRRRQSAVESVFTPFGLRMTPHRVGYRTVQALREGERNETRWFTNFPLDDDFSRDN
jgi:hypothetical protein